MQIRHEPSGETGRFTLGAGTAEMTYKRREDGVVVFDHTFVPEPERGQGIAAVIITPKVWVVEPMTWYFALLEGRCGLFQSAKSP